MPTRSGPRTGSCAETKTIPTRPLHSSLRCRELFGKVGPEDQAGVRCRSKPTSPTAVPSSRTIFGHRPKAEVEKAEADAQEGKGKSRKPPP